MYNYTRQVCTSDGKGNRTCTTVYYCQKDNVTAFKINKEGKWFGRLTWTDVLLIRIVGGYDVVLEDNNFYVIYGSSFQLMWNKYFSLIKSRKQRSYKFEYGVFNYETGVF